MTTCCHAETSICNTSYLERKVQALQAIPVNKAQQALTVLPPLLFTVARTELLKVVELACSIMCSAPMSSSALPMLQVTQVMEHIVSLFGKLDHDASNMCISTAC